MPSREGVRQAVAAMKRTADFEFFFGELKSPGWIEPLRQEGQFDSPWPPIREGEYIRFPSWPQAGYLRRMAPVAPEQVRDVILALPETENIRVHDDLTDAALAMPPALAAEIVPKIRMWLGSRHHGLLPDKAGQLVARLAKAGLVDPALYLAATLLSVQPASDDDPYEARSHVEDFQYEPILQKYVPDLVDAAGTRGIRLLADLLQQAVELSQPRGEDGEDHSYIWHQSIETSDQDTEHSIRSFLVRATRDAADRALASQPALLPKVIADLGARRWTIFRRLALHVLRTHRAHAAEDVRRHLLDPVALDDSGVFHEFWLLAREALPSLSPEDQRQFFEQLEAAYGSELMAEEKESEEPALGQLRARRWLYRRLSILHEALPGSWKARCESLKAEFGELEHPEYLSYISPIWAGPTSPKDEQEIARMSVPELTGFLRTWKPSGKWNEASMDGLGRSLSAAVEHDPAKYATAASAFRAFDPTYVRWLFWGLTQGRRAKRTFPWVPVLDLSSWVLSQAVGGEDEGPEDEDRDRTWAGTRRAIADLLSIAFDTSEGAMPFNLRHAAWQVLAPLTEDPDPTPEHEARFGGNNMDSLTLSINTTRGSAMHAVVEYALWVSRTIVGTESTGQGSFAEMPEVRKVLDARLDPLQEPSLAIRAVFGRWYPWLLLLDPEWAKGAIPRIFPTDRNLARLRIAAWDAYVLFSGVFENVLGVLHGEYDAAIKRLGKQPRSTRPGEEPNRRLTEHLMIFQWRGKLDIDDPKGLLRQFYQRAPVKLREHALGFIGHTLHGEERPPLPPEVRDRMQKLWSWRLSEAALLPREERVAELAEFGWWFDSGKFDGTWSIRELLKALRLTRKVEMTHRVVEKLAEISGPFTAEALEALTLIVEGDAKSWDFPLWSSHAETIMKAALKSGISALRDETRYLIDVFVSRGNRSYVHLLENGAG